MTNTIRGAMFYDPQQPDPISVAAHIARIYRIKHGVTGEAMVTFYTKVSEAARFEFDAINRPMSLKKAMGLVMARGDVEAAIAEAIHKKPSIALAYAARLQGEPPKRLSREESVTTQTQGEEEIATQSQEEEKIEETVVEPTLETIAEVETPSKPPTTALPHTIIKINISDDPLEGLGDEFNTGMDPQHFDGPLPSINHYPIPTY